MSKSFAHSSVALATWRICRWWALALFALGEVAPLCAQYNGILDYIGHQYTGEVHDTVLPTNISLYDSPYFDANGNILGAPLNGLGQYEPFYLFNAKAIYYYSYDSQGLHERFPLEIPFGTDISLSAAAQVSYSAHEYLAGYSNTGSPYYEQRAWLTGTRNSLYLYNLTPRVRLNTITLASQPDAPIFRPGNALLAYGTAGVFMTSLSGGIYYLSNDQLGVSDGHVIPLVTAQGSGPGEVNNPSALSIGPDGLLYVLDAGNNRIQKFDPATGAYHGGFDLPNGLTVYSKVMQVDANGGAVLDANGNYIYTNTSGNVFSTSLAISQEGHIYLGDGAGGGFVLDSQGHLLSTFHPPAESANYVDDTLVATAFGKLPGAGSFLSYDGYGNIFTYVEGKGLFLYRDPTYPMLTPSHTFDVNVVGDSTLDPGESYCNALTFQPGGKLKIGDHLNVAAGYIYMFGDGTIAPGGTLATSSNFVKAGKGTLTLNNENTYTGTTVVLTGTLIVNGSVAGDVAVRDQTTLGGSGTIGGSANLDNGATLCPGDETTVGLLTIKGDLTLADTSTLLLRLGGTGAGMWDQLTVEGSLNADGILSLQILDGYLPTLGDSFKIFNADEFQGTFNSIVSNLGDIDPGYEWDTSSLASDGIVTVVPEPSTWLLLAFGLGLALWRTRGFRLHDHG